MFRKCSEMVEQDDSVYPSIRSSRGGGAKAKRGRACRWLKTECVTLALGSDRFMMGAEIRLSRRDTSITCFHVNRESFFLRKAWMK